GSTRVVLAARGGGLTSVQATDYYPFGMAHGSLNNLHLNRYLYGGKEYQDALINGQPLGLYDFHARYYNPMLGRWFNIDPALQTTNPYLYCGNSPMMYVDPDGEFFFSLLLPGIGFFLDAACWGAAIGGVGYTASVAMSDGGFSNWNWGQFGQSVGMGAVSGAVSFGIGSGFSALGSFAGNVGTQGLQGLAHGLAQGGLSSLQGGNFMSGFASGTLGSWAASGYQATGLSKSLGTGGMLGFGSLSGGLGSWATGGDFWQGAANGLMVATFNQLPRLNWRKATPQQRIDGILDAQHEAFSSGADYFDMREVFEDFPRATSGAKLDLAGHMTLDGDRVPTHVSISVYDDMKVNVNHSLSRQLNPTGRVGWLNKADHPWGGAYLPKWQPGTATDMGAGRIDIFVPWNYITPLSRYLTR
ncbi:MAG: RHS repeat-associated core domain-containing protein, partial [Rikenellaceae bacterium]|nr:RHS repeat-associated core domain-containing protein [Rikenellaceae bacterium]